MCGVHINLRRKVESEGRVQGQRIELILREAHWMREKPDLLVEAKSARRKTDIEQDSKSKGL